MLETTIDVTEAQERTYNLLSEHTGEDGITLALSERKDVDDTTPAPGQLAMTRSPLAQALRMLGTPIRERESKASGSMSRVLIQRHSASIRFSPAIVRT